MGLISKYGYIPQIQNLYYELMNHKHIRLGPQCGNWAMVWIYSGSNIYKTCIFSSISRIGPSPSYYFEPRPPTFTSKLISISQHGPLWSQGGVIGSYLAVENTLKCIGREESCLGMCVKQTSCNIFLFSWHQWHNK